MESDLFDERANICQRIVELADIHVCAIRHFLPDFPSRATAYRTIARLRKERRLRCVGHVVMCAAGRPETVFCNTWKPSKLRHELLLTDFLLCYPKATIVRGWRVDKRIRADAEMMLDGRKFFVELDTGEQSYRQVRDRQLSYAGVQDFLLYVTLSERRLQGLLGQADAVKGIALFSTLRRVQVDPAGEVWTDCYGGRAAIVQA